MSISLGETFSMSAKSFMLTLWWLLLQMCSLEIALYRLHQNDALHFFQTRREARRHEARSKSQADVSASPQNFSLEGLGVGLVTLGVQAGAFEGFLVERFIVSPAKEC